VQNSKPGSPEHQQAWHRIEWLKNQNGGMPPLAPRHHAQAGAKGGASTSEAKAIAARQNGKLGGRPRITRKEVAEAVGAAAAGISIGAAMILL